MSKCLQGRRTDDPSLLWENADAPVPSVVLYGSCRRHCSVHGLLLCPFRGLTMKADKRWFVTRELQDSADRKLTVEVQLGFPELRDKAFRCAFRVKGLNQGKVAYAGGVDALQALINAIEGIATQLRESGRALTWMGGILVCGDRSPSSWVPSLPTRSRPSSRPRSRHSFSTRRAERRKNRRKTRKAPSSAPRTRSFCTRSPSCSVTIS